MALLGAVSCNYLCVRPSFSSVRDYQAGGPWKDTVHNSATVLRRTCGASSFSTEDGEGALVCGGRSRNRNFRVRSSTNGSAAAAASSLNQVETEEVLRTEEVLSMMETAIAEPSCSMPDIALSTIQVTLLNPLNSLPAPLQVSQDERSLLLYVPGMDCTGQGIRRQLTNLIAAGYDIRCVFIPSNDRSSWSQLVQKLVPLVEKEVGSASGRPRHLTVLGESFGGCLAIRLAKAAPKIVSRLVLINPATNFAEANSLASFCASTGLLTAFPEPLYEFAQDIMLPMMVKKNRVSKEGNKDMLSPIDFVPTQCAAWRFSMLNDLIGLSDSEIQSIDMPTLLFASSKDRVLSSVTECARLQRLLPNSKRVILAESGHTVLLEDSINIASLLSRNGFAPPLSDPEASTSSSSSATTSQSMPPARAEYSTQPISRLQKRKHAVPDERFDELGNILEPWKILTSPLVSGAENLPNSDAEPRRPLLFVGNHTIFGIYDSPVLVHELFLRGFRVRGLAHPGHWATGVGGLFERYGNVKATKFSAYKLLKDGEDVLLFPGGAREVCKRKGEEYKLMWQPTVDFVRMAGRLNAIIVPFGVLGADDAYKILIDGDEFLRSPLGPIIRAVYERLKISTENIYPLTTLPVLGLPSLIPIPGIERIYIHFADPIDTVNYKCNLENRDECKDLYALVKQRVEDSLVYLKQVRENDPERSLPMRLLSKAIRLLPERNSDNNV